MDEGRPWSSPCRWIWLFGGAFVPRHSSALQRARSETESYIREVAGKSPAEQIADAKALLDAGTITQAEFDRLKAKALA